jgi:protein-S-isoprenylcysteine O-methyltransferase Ste14
MATAAKAIAGSFVFFWVAPGTVAGWIPYELTGWRLEPPFFGIAAVRVAGVALIVAGLVLLIECFRRFALEGRGTPAPIAPPKTLVASGFYRRVRNPMYVSIVAIIIGQAFVLGSSELLIYAAVVWLIFHCFVTLYEEPRLARVFDRSYETYRANVPRWIPRRRPWRG